MSTLETNNSIETADSPLEFTHDLPEDGLHYTISQDSEGQADTLVIKNDDNEIQYEHTPADGPINSELLRKDLKAIGLQEISIASIIEQLS